MKKIANRTLVTTTVLSFLLIINTQGFSQWNSQVSPTNSNLNKIYFTNDLEGWIVGDSGTILHTNNGGENWVVQTSNTYYHLRNMSFPSANTGWVVGGPNFSQYGVVLKTENGGDTWPTVMTTDDSPFTGVFFTSSLNGWLLQAAFNDDSILHTTNGGLTWKKVFFFPQNLYFEGPRLNIFFLDSLHGWIVSYRDSWGIGADLFKTVDGGMTWIPGWYDVQCLRKIFFTDLNHGWACGCPNADMDPWGTIIFSNDNENWSELFPGYYKYFNDIIFVDNQNGWTITESGDILVSMDGGINWKHQYGGSEALNGIFFLPGGAKGWAVGDNGKILSTDNGGFPVLVPETDQNEDILIYPNPAIDKIAFSVSNGEKITNVKIYNPLGQQLVSIEKVNGRIDVSILSTGIYLIEYNVDSKIFRKRLAIQ